ncbi:MAG: TolC family protein [Bryobacteraceae bacterium]|nr:TolC family protein [Bryobacteraceae bacterium]
MMRLKYLLPGTLFLALSLGAQQPPSTFQQYIPGPGVKSMPDGAAVLDAPVFGTGAYFRTHFRSEQPRIFLKAPARLSDFAVDGHIELSLKNYLELVLANNTDIEVQKWALEIPRNAITRSLGAFDPAVLATFRSTRDTTPTASELDGAPTLTRLTQPLSFTYQQTLDTGTIYSLGFSGNKFSSNSAFATVNPSIGSSLDFSVQQPLLRNFGRFNNRLAVMVAESQLKRSRHDVETELFRLIQVAENTYWAVVEARENLRVNEEALRLADALLKRAEKELELGAISPLDIYQPQQTKANREIFVTQSHFRLEQTIDALRRQIGADLDPDFRRVPIELTEPVLPPTETAAPEPEQLIERAYLKRPDLKSALQGLDIDDLNFDFARNQLKPDLALGLFYSTSGLGGTTFTEQQGVPRVIPGGLGDALSQVFGFNFPTYGFSLSLRLPIRDRRGAANMADAVVSKRLNTLRARNIEQGIRLDVLTAVNNLESSKAGVRLAQVSVDFAQKRVDAEQKKYDLGVTTIFFLLQAQNDLASSQAELVTQAAQYRRNLTNLLRVTGDLLEERGVVVQ